MLGIFAGRGDVLLSMALCLVIGYSLGWISKAKYIEFQEWFLNFKNKFKVGNR